MTRVADVLLTQCPAIDVLLSAYSFGHGCQITASFGIASLNEHRASPGELIRAAGEAFYAPRRAGKNRAAAYRELAVSAAGYEVWLA